ncbi:hypothetical protein [Flagellimonas allohymeniacidonis]|uniref:Bulb-type lectin domain-containing protein n=1 Tax=Flagellimonas allohymeniacidonis TaxID=2517819 RepID=A0A4Q8QE81_9FLAO|nr:hypothetical protein [Allomuricauda hymeniacidonis]TAI47458.1 hypothetical protein EW142_12360 [Allomuricauda hymeniacidonis]
MNAIKRTFALLVIILGFSCSNDDSSSDPPSAVSFLGEVDWMKTYGGSGDDTAQSVTSTSDGGYAILGYSNSADGDLIGKTTTVNDYWLLKLDTDGNLQWSKTYGGSKDDRGQSVIQTIDGGYAIVGYAMSDDGDGSNNEGFHDNWILRLDANGAILWEKSFGFSGHDHSYDVVQTADGGFFFSGFLDVTSSGGEGNTGKGNYLTQHGVGEFWGTKLDANGELVWRRYFGGTNNDRSYGVVEANDGSLVLTGASESDDFDISNAKGSYDFWVVKVSPKGELVWERSFGGTGIDKAFDITKTEDGAYVIVGNTFSVDIDISKNNGESDVWLIKVDDQGNLVWEKTYGGTAFDAAQSVKTTLDGGFVIAGNSKSVDGNLTQNLGENDLWVIKTDASGNLEYQQNFGGSGLDFGFDVVESIDGSLLLVGETASTDIANIPSIGMIDLMLIKIK